MTLFFVDIINNDCVCVCVGLGRILTYWYQ